MRKILLFLNIFAILYCILHRHEKESFQSLEVFSCESNSCVVGQTSRVSKTRSTLKSPGAIVILTSRDFTQVAVQLSSIDQHLLDNYENHIIICHSGYPFSSDISRILRSTRRNVVFRNVDKELTSFPQGFDPYSNQPTWSRRGKWSYHQMIRFWFKMIFEMPEIQQYDYIMRLDDDSQLLGLWFNIFTKMRERSAVYFANNECIDEEHILPGTMKLKELSYSYKRSNKLFLKDHGKFERAFLTNGIRTYYNNFEVMNIHFFRQSSVRKWTEWVDASHGIYKYRWGDAILRYLTLSLFANSEQILHREDYNLSYCHPC